MQQDIPNICTKFQNPGCSYSWEIFDTNFPMSYIGVLDGKKKNGKRRQKLISASWFSFPQFTWPLSRCIQNLKTLALTEAEKSVTEILLERKKNGQIKRIISRKRLILSYTIQVIPNICTKFQNPRFSSFWEIFGEKKSLHTHPHTNTHTQTLLLKRQKLYTPYILRIPGV